jgi:hypothetical protein
LNKVIGWTPKLPVAGDTHDIVTELTRVGLSLDPPMGW